MRLHVRGSSRVGFLHAAERMFRETAVATFPATRRTDSSHDEGRSLFVRLSIVCHNVIWIPWPTSTSRCGLFTVFR